MLSEVHYIRDLARLLRCEFLGMFYAYFDESGIHGESKIFVMACYLAPAKEWERFIPKWQAVLNKYGIKVFHASHCNGNKGEFRKFKENQEQRNEFVVELLSTISVRPRIVPFCIGVDFKGYDDFFRPMMEPSPEHPYHIAMKTQMAQIGRYLQESKRIVSSVKVACVFDRQAELGPRALTTFNQGLKNWEGGGRFSSITFASLNNCVPLQAADALAYDSYREMSRRQYHPERKVRPSYRLLIKNAVEWSTGLYTPRLMKELIKRPDTFMRE